MGAVRWFCTRHRAAGVAADPVCCTSALLCACETDERVWYRFRVETKPLGWDAVRWSTPARIDLIRNNARRHGRWFITARVRP